MSKYSPIITDICSIDASHIIDDRGEPPLWPLNVVEVLWFLGKFYPKELYESVFSLKEKGYSRENIAKLFQFPTRLTDLFHFIEVPIEGLIVTQREKLFEEVVEIAKIFREDPFCKNNKNEIWPQEKVKKIVEGSDWRKVNHKDNKNVDILSKLHALMFLYSEFIWVGGRHPLSHELHGPYSLDKNRVLLVREYYDLKAPVWSFANAVPITSFRLLEIYGDISIKLDCYNHLETSEPLPPKLKSFSFPHSDISIEVLYNGIKEALTRANEEVKNYKKTDWLKKAIEMQAWSLKPFKDKLGEDWKLSSGLLEMIEKTDAAKEIEEIFQEIRKIMIGDPKFAIESLGIISSKNSIQKMIKGFEEINKEDVAVAGGKGASLGEMTQAGISVPPGFVVLAETFDKFIELTDVSIELDAMWNRLDIENTDNLEENSVIIQDVILKKKFPKELGRETLKAFDKLNAKYVAVRSSATAEDSKQDAWAGQLETYLYVTRDNLIPSVQKCYASLFSPRALFYRVERGCKENVSVAVVVQEMINSEVAGVCFTVHPVTRDKDQMIIEACHGLGESLVQGIITPDSYVIEKSTLKIIDINVNFQERQIIKGDKGVKTIELAGKLKEKQKLSEEQIKELASLCINIENHYKSPQDVEWALENDKFYIVQARPITTL